MTYLFYLKHVCTIVTHWDNPLLNGQKKVSLSLQHCKASCLESSTRTIILLQHANHLYAAYDLLGTNIDSILFSY